jgi:hypothetical protein
MGGIREVPRAENIDCVGLLGSRATEESRAVDHGIDAAQRRCERIHFEQIALGELDASFAQVGGARGIAHEGAYLIAALGKSFGESASDFSGRSGDEDPHTGNVVTGARRRLGETFGVSPKAFAKLARFHRALSAAREDVHASWASIAAAAGYYDQAHLIAEFRAIAGVTPRALLGELRAAPPVG